MVLVGRGELEAQAFPHPDLGPDDGLLRVELAGICHTDVDILSGSFDSPLPLIMGHEIAGIIEAVGERAARKWRVAPGDRVAVEPMAGCGTCRYCTGGESRFCADAVGYGTSTSSARAPHLFGAYSPLMYLAPGSLVHRLPAGMSAESGMLCTVAISNGVQARPRRRLAGRPCGGPGCGPDGGVGGGGGARRRRPDRDRHRAGA
jgi:alcohol dehydrogenase